MHKYSMHWEMLGIPVHSRGVPCNCASGMYENVDTSLLSAGEAVPLPQPALARDSRAQALRNVRVLVQAARSGLLQGQQNPAQPLVSSLTCTFAEPCALMRTLHLNYLQG